MYEYIYIYIYTYIYIYIHIERERERYQICTTLQVGRERDDVKEKASSCVPRVKPQPPRLMIQLRGGTLVSVMWPMASC